MNRINCSLGEVDIQITAGSIRVNYAEIPHEEFNTLIALYELLGFREDRGLTLVPELPAQAPTAAPEEIPV